MNQKNNKTIKEISKIFFEHKISLYFDEEFKGFDEYIARKRPLSKKIMLALGLVKDEFDDEKPEHIYYYDAALWIVKKFMKRVYKSQEDLLNWQKTFGESIECYFGPALRESEVPSILEKLSTIIPDILPNDSKEFENRLNEDISLFRKTRCNKINKLMKNDDTLNVTTFSDTIFAPIKLDGSFARISVSSIDSKWKTTYLFHINLDRDKVTKSIYKKEKIPQESLGAIETKIAEKIINSI